MMNVKPIGINGYADPTAAGYAIDSKNEKGTTTVETLLEKLQSPSTDSKALRDIADDYDIQSIKPQELSEMLGRLHESGVITDDEYQMLGQLRVELEEAGYEADEPVDLIRFCEAKLKEIEEKQEDAQKVPENAQKNTQAQLAWLQKMAIIQENPESVGINALI